MYANASTHSSTFARTVSPGLKSVTMTHIAKKNLAFLAQRKRKKVAHFRLVKCPSAIRDHLGFFIFVLAAFFVQAFIESGHRSRTYGR